MSGLVTSKLPLTTSQLSTGKSAAATPATPPAEAPTAATVTLERGKKATVNKFDDVYFTDPVVEQLERDGIPYPREFFVVVRIGTESDTGRPNDITVMGSMGGRYTFDATKPVVKRVDHHS